MGPMMWVVARERRYTIGDVPIVVMLSSFNTYVYEFIVPTLILAMSQDFFVYQSLFVLPLAKTSSTKGGRSSHNLLTFADHKRFAKLAT